MIEPNPDLPFLLIIAGPNGAGKSSHWDREYRSRSLRLPYINADEIARSLPNSPARDRDAMFEAEKRRREHIERLESFAFETVFSHIGKLKEIERAKKAGYYVRLVFIGLANAQLSIARVLRRVACGGHNVPLDRIPGRYERGLKNLAKAVMLVDEAVIWDNSTEDESPTAVLELRNGKIKKGAVSLPTWLRDCLEDVLRDEAGSAVESKPPNAGSKGKR